MRKFLNLTISGMVILFAQILCAQDKGMRKIAESNPAPMFVVNDVYGSKVNLIDLKGKKVMLTLYRNVGCAICNLRFHQLEEESSYFKSKDLVLLAVYESTAKNMLLYLDGENVYPRMIPDPELNLYELYGIERSTGKLLKGMFHGGLKKEKEGKKLFRQKIKKDGKANRISADFLIDEDGIIRKAYYGKYVGDHLAIEEIKRFLE